MNSVTAPSRRARWFFAASTVVVPVLVMLVWTANHGWRASHGERVELSVQGYDPRDLLAGHYLQYTVDYGAEAPPCPFIASLEPTVQEANIQEPPEPQCVCLTRYPNSARHVAVWSGGCSDMTHCPIFVRGRCVGSRFEAGIERFYMPEGYQSRLAVVPEKSSIVVSVSPDGEAHVLDFLVDGIPVSRYAQDPESH